MNENLPTITVITVTYNLIKNGRKEFFKQCLESVHNQTYQNIEHLIIDGASTDGTLDIIKEYANKGWIKYISEPDSGHWNAMNKGAKLATGKYIAYLNSDDFYCDKNAIELCISELEKHDENCYSVANFKVIKPDGSKFHDNNEDYKPLSKELFYRRQTYNHETLICPKSIYEKLGYHNEKYKIAIDTEFNMKLVLNDYKQIYIPVCMVVFRLGGATSTENGNFSQESINDTFLLFQDIYPWAKLRKSQIKLFYQEKYPEKFLRRVEQEIIARNLKNFDYEIFKQDIKSWLPLNKKYYLFSMLCIFVRSEYREYITYKILGLPIIRIERRYASKIYKLFGFLPLLKITEK